MKYFFLLVIGVGSVLSVKAQRTEDSVKAVIDRFFIAMKSADTNLLAAALTETVILQTVGRDRSGQDVVRSEDLKSLKLNFSRLKKDSADERIIYESIKIDGPLASVWTPYKFYYAGQLSHCGVNSFQVVRLKGEWRIQYIIDTRRKTKCN